MLLITSGAIINVLIISLLITLCVFDEIKKELMIRDFDYDFEIFCTSYMIISMLTLTFVVFIKTIKYTISLFV